MLDERRNAPRDIYDLELLLARGNCPSRVAVERIDAQTGGLIKRLSDKLDLLGWALFRDEVLPTLPEEMHAHVDESEYIAMKLRLLEAIERCMADPPGKHARS